MADQYATIAQLIERYDVRVLGQLVNDNDTQTASGSLTSNATLTAMIEDATAQVKSAALAGGAYTESQLDTVNTDGDPLMVRLVCDLAMGLLLQRRAAGIPAGHQERVDAANDSLDALRRGTRVFSTHPNSTADVPAAHRGSVADLRRRYPATNSALYPAPQESTSP